MKFNPEAKIVYYPHPALTTKTDLVVEFNEDLHLILDQMKEKMIQAKGVGLSANQLGYNLRAFIVSDKKGKVWEFINSEITELDGVANIYEGCLSSPNVYEKVLTRANSVTIKAFDRNNQEFTIMSEGLEAVALQHETDHGLGLFWFDKLPNRETKKRANKLWEKNRRKMGL